MEYIPMVIGILSIVYFSLFLDKKFGILTPISIISLSFLFYYSTSYKIIEIKDYKDFSVLLLSMLPIMLIGDSLYIKLKDVEKYWFSLLYLAGIAIILSIFAGIFITNNLFSQYHLDIKDIILIMVLLLPTDPVSVISVFNKFKLPHSLKFKAEGESLINDGVSMSIYVGIALPLIHGINMTFYDMSIITIKSLTISGFIGLIVGFIMASLMFTTNDRIKEFIIILLTGYISFYISEHFFHVSGIFSIIVSILVLNYFIDKAINKHKEKNVKIENIVERASMVTKISKESRVKRLLNIYNKNIIDGDRFDQIKNYFILLGLIVNAIIFISIGELISINTLLQYKYEIIYSFIVITLLRMLMVLKLATLSQHFVFIKNIDIKSWLVLSFAGIKGGLNIAMVTMIPENYQYKDMFTAIVVGNVLLSIFIYSILLIIIINIFKNEFEEEYILEKS